MSRYLRHPVPTLSLHSLQRSDSWGSVQSGINRPSTEVSVGPRSHGAYAVTDRFLPSSSCGAPQFPRKPDKCRQRQNVFTGGRSGTMQSATSVPRFQSSAQIPSAKSPSNIPKRRLPKGRGRKMAPPPVDWRKLLSEGAEAVLGLRCPTLEDADHAEIDTPPQSVRLDESRSQCAFRPMIPSEGPDESIRSVHSEPSEFQSTELACEPFTQVTYRAVNRLKSLHIYDTLREKQQQVVINAYRDSIVIFTTCLSVYCPDRYRDAARIQAISILRYSPSTVGRVWTAAAIIMYPINITVESLIGTMLRQQCTAAIVATHYTTAMLFEREGTLACGLHWTRSENCGEKRINYDRVRDNTTKFRDSQSYDSIVALLRPGVFRHDDSSYRFLPHSSNVDTLFVTIDLLPTSTIEPPHRTVFGALVQRATTFFQSLRPDCLSSRRPSHSESP